MSNHAFFLHSLSAEFNRFHNVVAALPADKHHPRSRWPRRKQRHRTGGERGKGVPFRDHADALSLLDSSFHAVTEKMKTVTDESWATPGDFKVATVH